MTEDNILTPEGKNKLEEELNYLKNTKRKDITERIETAKEHGDLSENAEYHEAREDQSFTEGRIKEIEHILKNATVVMADKSGHVQVGSKVSVEMEGNQFEFSIVGSHEGDPSQGMLSCDSPIGEALLGKKAGDQVEIKTPKGLVSYTIKKVQ
ncbi:MAG: transcription elongation factor GreA [Candidatus Komeilibacteria bacterium CG10_big_fil_rev_8_21_14_0_10_41_13]|uniref:Transcription elongation factor GreA n=1 Tax=Candidatus Komeilibacteria bacterium CG10_big_fil_rev_8_21_14_0_10_41_13 TaxID=1974476 RepID=A0A2M6WCL8_9BACT|nr:MAG: transcription elongation factor GreA [Candidatus Komeilibacteria bacterium CG10_big_fil_rev_8_21_14_0_10_41_13]